MHFQARRPGPAGVWLRSHPALPRPSLVQFSRKDVNTSSVFRPPWALAFLLFPGLFTSAYIGLVCFRRCTQYGLTLTSKCNIYFLPSLFSAYMDFTKQNQGPKRETPFQFPSSPFSPYAKMCNFPKFRNGTQTLPSLLGQSFTILNIQALLKKLLRLK